jgi:tetratricopeptide (TPR) repeat protein
MTEAALAPLEAALAHGERLAAARPDLAELQAREILAQAPNEPRARLLLGSAQRRQGDIAAARATLEALAADEPRSAATRLELGLTLSAAGHANAALAAFRAAVRLKPNSPDAWRAIADHLHLQGDAAGADAAYARHIQAGVHEPALREAALAMVDGKLAIAERLLRDHLRQHPTDVAAMRMLAEIGTRLGRYHDAEGLLEVCLDLAPSFHPARHNLALVLFRQQKAQDALPHIEALRRLDPAEPNWRVLHASCLGLVGDYATAAAIFEEALAEAPNQPGVWLSLGHARRTEGKRAEAVAAYRRAIALEPGLGDAYWSLANLKTQRFDAAEIAAMQAQLKRPEIVGEDRFHLHYALGKALEDLGDWAGAFGHYAEGARLRREEAPYDPGELTGLVDRSTVLFTRDFLAARADWGAPAPDPIFILGLPRSGSTLVEQILASHSAVEGTMELAEIGAIAREFGRAARRGRGAPYPEVLGELAAEDIARIGQTFLDRTKIQRKQGKPLFIDKMPNNFQHLGLIRLALPKARVIDARRHPMATGFSCFKQHFARGQAFSYELGDIGRYYADYLRLMRHFDALEPGRVVRVIHEDLVANPEAEIRRLLGALDLGFEPACLNFHATDRAVRTASSEQVRQPIFREGLDHWRHFEPWLGPLKAALGPALETWRT